MKLKHKILGTVLSLVIKCSSLVKVGAQHGGSVLKLYTLVGWAERRLRQKDAKVEASQGCKVKF